MKMLGSRWLLPVLGIFYGVNMMDRSVLGIVGDAIKADLHLTDAQLGMVHSILLIMLIFLLIPGSVASDLFGRRRILGLAAGIWTCAMAFTGLAASFAQLICARALSSVNEGTAGAGATAWLASYFPAARRGSVLGKFQVSAPLGMCLGTVLGGVVLTLTGSWRLSFFLFVIPGILCTLLIPRLPDNQPPAEKGYFRELLRTLNLRTMLYCGIGTGFFCIIKFAYQTWLPVLILRSYDGITAITAGAMAASFLLAAAIGPIISGIVSDKMNARYPAGRVYVLIGCLGIVAASKLGLYWMVCRGSLPVLEIYGLFDGVCTMLPLPVYFTIIQDVVPERLRSGACGVMGAIIYLSGGAWGPLLVGSLSDYFGGGAEGLRMAELALLIFPVLAMCVYALDIRPYVREKAAAEKMNAVV